MTRIFKLCASLLLALGAAAAQAANYAGTTFEIEMIVFERTGGMEQARETWPAAPQLKYPRQWVDFDTTEGDSLFLTPAATRLDNKAAALNRGGSYRVLFHKAWRQVLQQKRNSPAILISGGERFGGHTQLEGSVTVSVSRYLHLSSNLWLSEFGGADEGGILLPQVPRAVPSEPADLPAATNFQPSFQADEIGTPAPQPVYASHVARLQQERRMRSGELHYLDHPAFGVLIEVRKVESENNDQ